MFDTRKVTPDICRIVESGIPCYKRVEGRGVCAPHRKKLTRALVMDKYSLPRQNKGSNSFRGWRIFGGKEMEKRA